MGNRNNHLQTKLDAAKADYTREKDIITFLVQKELIKAPAKPQQPSLATFLRLDNYWMKVKKAKQL